MAGIKLNQNIKIMDRKVLKDKIDELRSTAKMELACTIREIMREHNVQKKELDWSVYVGDRTEVYAVEIEDSDTAIPIMHTRDAIEGLLLQETGSLDDSISVELLADIATELNNELNGYVCVYEAKYRFLYDDGTTAPMDEPYCFQAESEKEAREIAEDYLEVWNECNDDTIEIVSVEKQTASES